MKHEIKQFVNDELCHRKARKEVEISLPVEIRGFAKVGEVEAKCCGHAEIVPNSDFCPGEHDAVVKFVIRQKIKVEIPVTFGVKTDVGEEKMHFDESIDLCGCECGCNEDKCGFEECVEEITEERVEERVEENGGNRGQDHRFGTMRYR